PVELEHGDVLGGGAVDGPGADPGQADHLLALVGEGVDEDVALRLVDDVVVGQDDVAPGDADAGAGGGFGLDQDHRADRQLVQLGGGLLGAGLPGFGQHRQRVAAGGGGGALLGQAGEAFGQ